MAVASLVLHHQPEPAASLAEMARVLKPGGRVLVVDMLPHDRLDYQQQMGHVWLGFSTRRCAAIWRRAGFADVRVRALPVATDAQGPALFAATAGRQRLESSKTSRVQSSRPQSKGEQRWPQWQAPFIRSRRPARRAASRSR